MAKIKTIVRKVQKFARTRAAQRKQAQNKIVTRVKRNISRSTQTGSVAGDIKKSFSAFSSSPKYSFVAGGAAIGSSGIAGQGVKTSSIFTKAKTGIQRTATNPFAGQTVKKGFQTIGKRALGGFAAIEGFELARSVASGQKYNPIPSLSKLKGAFAFGINPFSAALGATAGIGQKIGTSVLDKAQSVPQPTVPDFNFDFPQVPQYEPIQQSFIFQEPSVPTGITSPVGAFAPSLSVETGGGDLTPLLILLLLGGLGGYAIGKRKTKKNKKKKKRK